MNPLPDETLSADADGSERFYSLCGAALIAFIAVASAFYVFLKYAKLWERSRASGNGDRCD